MKNNKTRGIYVFADGYNCWVSGYSASEKKAEIKKHGPIIKFTPTK